MVKFVKGEIVKLPFPFSDFSGCKGRPAIVIQQLTGDDVILCQITTREMRDTYSIPLFNEDFLYGSLPVDGCYIRPNKIWTHDSNRILERKGKVNPNKIKEVIDGIVNLIQA